VLDDVHGQAAVLPVEGPDPGAVKAIRVKPAARYRKTSASGAGFSRSGPSPAKWTPMGASRACSTPIWRRRAAMASAMTTTATHRAT